MLALLDVWNCFASCEEVFRPVLRTVPFAVLGSNDGCVIARNELARKIGVKMGEPAFKLRPLQDLNNLLLLSVNAELYSDMSMRVHSILSGLSDRVTPYSIDEIFADLNGMPGNHADRCRRMVERVETWTGLKMGCGIGQSATLAKLGSFIAKQAIRRPGSYPVELAHICDLGSCSPSLLRDCLAATPVNEVWGVGRRYADDLLQGGVINALDLARFDPGTARKRWGVVMERTIRELNGVSCITVEGKASKQQIVTSRSLAKAIESCDELESIAALLVSNAARKLRLQGSVCGAVSVYAMTSPFREGPRFARSKVVPMGQPTCDDRKLAEAVTHGMRCIWEPGYELVKVGVMLVDLCDKAQADAQGRLELGMDDEPDAKESALMLAVDQLNSRYGRKTVRLGVEQTQPITRSERMTPRYTTRLADVPVVRA